MFRRNFLAGTAAAPFAVPLGALLVPIGGGVSPARAATPGKWRSFEITQSVDIAADTGAAKLWLPLPQNTLYQRFDSLRWSGAASLQGVYRDPASGAEAFHAQWENGEAPRKLTLTLQVSTLDRRTEFDRYRGERGAAPAEMAPYLQSGAMIRTDGIVKETAEKIVAGKADNLAKARAIYDWIADNTFRDAKVKGCGIGDIRTMLTTGNLGGKCADLNALFVGLARAAGVPARGVYGVRVAPSAISPSIGAKTDNISRGQHCRAEFWTASLGWVPADAADVRKIVLEDNVPIDDPRMKEFRRFLFGSWEGNWIAYNDHRDIVLPRSAGEPVNFFMYPEAHTAKGPLDGVDPDSFAYKITAREIKEA